MQTKKPAFLLDFYSSILLISSWYGKPELVFPPRIQAWYFSFIFAFYTFLLIFSFCWNLICRLVDELNRMQVNVSSRRKRLDVTAIKRQLKTRTFGICKN